jgi:hypothetical protein
MSAVKGSLEETNAVAVNPGSLIPKIVDFDDVVIPASETTIRSIPRTVARRTLEVRPGF